MSELAKETAPLNSFPHRDVWQSMKRGWRQKCPSCGDGALYGKYLKVSDQLPQVRNRTVPPAARMTLRPIS